LLYSASDAGLVVEEFRDDTQDYIHTITEWIYKLQKNKSDIEKMYDNIPSVAWSFIGRSISEVRIDFFVMSFSLSFVTTIKL
jgi:cyclopropane fatty-acyl-phospholipid synthase-like methyltransferase